MLTVCPDANGLAAYGPFDCRGGSPVWSLSGEERTSGWGAENEVHDPFRHWTRGICCAAVTPSGKSDLPATMALSEPGRGPDLGPRVNEIHRKRGRRSLWRTFGVVSALVCVFSTLAIAADDQFVFSDDRFSVKVNVRDMPLGEVLRRLLENTPADIRWEDPALEKQQTTGSYNGPVANVLRQVLCGINFMIAYRDKDTVARVIVLGRPGQTAAVAPGVLVPAANSPPPPAPPPPQQTTQPVAPAQVPNPPRRTHDM